MLISTAMAFRIVCSIVSYERNAECGISTPYASCTVFVAQGHNLDL